MVAAASDHYSWVHVVASATFLVSMYPMFHFFAKRSEKTPAFAIISLAYGIYYSQAVFLPLRPYFLFSYLTQAEILYSALLSLLGVVTLVMGYYLWPTRPIVTAFPSLKGHVEGKRMIRAALIFTAACFVTLFIEKVNPAHMPAQIIVIIRDIGLSGFITLWLFSLRGKLNRTLTILLFTLLPLYVMLIISTGLTAPAALLGAALLLTYLTERRTIPWSFVIIGIVFMVPLMYAKHQFRAEIGFSGTLIVNSSQNSEFDPFSNALLFLGMQWQTLTEMTGPKLMDVLEIVVQRLDLIYLFGYIIQLTPTDVPYLMGESYLDLKWKFLPRFLDPDKPIEMWGQNFGHLYNILNSADNTTSINFPQLIEAYVNFGPIGIIVVMFILSQIYRAMTHFLNRSDQGDWGVILTITLAMDLIKIESNFSLVVGGLLYKIPVYYLIGRVLLKPTSNPETETTMQRSEVPTHPAM
jgi:hypothetical protein